MHVPIGVGAGGGVAGGGGGGGGVWGVIAMLVNWTGRNVRAVGTPRGGSSLTRTPSVLRVRRSRDDHNGGFWGSANGGSGSLVRSPGGEPGMTRAEP